jgi:hypothetical protein
MIKYRGFHNQYDVVARSLQSYNTNPQMKDYLWWVITVTPGNISILQEIVNNKYLHHKPLLDKLLLLS